MHLTSHLGNAPTLAWRQTVEFLKTL